MMVADLERCSVVWTRLVTRIHAVRVRTRCAPPLATSLFTGIVAAVRRHEASTPTPSGECGSVSCPAWFSAHGPPN